MNISLTLNLLVLLLISFSLGTTPLAKATEREESRQNQTVVSNPSTPTEGAQNIHFKENWRVGNSDDGVFFGCVSDVVFGDDGKIYLLDSILAEIIVLSKEGEFIRTISKRGEGPGEITRPVGIRMFSDQTIGIIQESPGRIVKLSLDGKPMGDIKISGSGIGEAGFIKLYDCAQSNGLTILVGEAISRTKNGRRNISFASTIDNEGQEITRLFESECEFDFSHFIFDEDARNGFDFNKLAVSIDGRVYIAGTRSSYDIHVFFPDGKLDRIFSRDFTKVERPKQQIVDLQKGIEHSLRRFPGAKVCVSPYLPNIERIIFGSDGNLWVYSSRSSSPETEDAFCTWDVFSPDGIFLLQRNIFCTGNISRDQLFLGPDGQAILVTEFVDARRRQRPNSNEVLDDDGFGEAKEMEVVYLVKQ